MKYEWKITGIKTSTDGDIKDAVTQVYWKKIGTNEAGEVGEFSGATPFKLEQVDPTNFTPFNQLTEAQVITWIQSVVVGDYEEHVNSRIQKQIDQLKVKPMEEVKLPWVIEAKAGE